MREATRGQVLDPLGPPDIVIVVERKLHQKGVLISRIATLSKPDERNIERSCLQEEISK